jgi:choline-sulfatase
METKYKKALKLILFVLILSIFSWWIAQKTNAQTSNKASQKYNILFIAVDDLRPELGVYGANHIQSPAIDKLASQSLIFDRAYCNVPVCGASRASFLSGVRPGRNRFLDYDTKIDEDFPGITSLPKHFKNNGYTTISNGKVYHHLSDDKTAWDKVWSGKQLVARDYTSPENINLEHTPGSRGFFFEKANVADNAYLDGKTADKTIKDLKKLKAEGKPFFLAAGFLKPHLPFNAPIKYWNLYDSTKISLPKNYEQPKSTPSVAFNNFGELRSYTGIPKEGPLSNQTAKKMIHGYYASVSYVDAQIGKVLNALEELGLAENTIVVLWGDHGWNLGDHQLWCKHNNFATALRVPLLIKVPNKTTGQRSNAIVEYIDVYPSLAELAGLPIPAHTNGESLVSLLDGKTRKKDFAISKYLDGITLVKGELFYTEWLDKENKIKDRMLFDHAKDPLEFNNLAEKPDYAKKTKELSDFLHQNWGEDFFLDRKKSDISPK